MKNKKNIYKELFDLVRSTGEKLVIINPDTDESIIIMPVSDYRKLQVKSEPKTDAVESENLSFWRTDEEDKPPIDKLANSGSIDTVQSDSPTDSQYKQINEEDEMAGDGYYFEPNDD